MKLPEGWSLRWAEYTMRGIRFEFDLTHEARSELINKGYQNTEITLAPVDATPDELGLYDAINKIRGYDMDPVGTVQWWGEKNRFVGDVAWNTPLEALKAGTLRIDQVIEEIDYRTKELG